jgi:hypothetical protein
VGYCPRMSVTRNISKRSVICPKRSVVCKDALIWLQEQEVIQHSSIVTSLPDHSEFPGLSLSEWKQWFVKASALVLSRCDENGVTIFYQSDIKHEGEWVDKAFLCQKAAEQEGHRLLWHKMICRAPVGEVTWGKPGFSHMLCFSKNLKSDISKSSADVFSDPGPTTWSRGMGLEACRFACVYILENTNTRTVVDPFCGHGTVLLAANELGMDAIGVDIFPKRAKRARTLQLQDLGSIAIG